MTDWVPDVLGDEFEQRTLPLGEDAEGAVDATLVRALPAPRLEHRPGGWERFVSGLRGLPAVDDAVPLLDGVDVLYVHGWSDYFFQKRLARFWSSRGARFFALDLRKYGRSLRDGQTPGYIADLTTYDEDIAAALDVIAEDADTSRGPRRLVLMGHSTGGLVLSLWASRHPGAPSAVILNSPWLEFQLAPLRAAIAPVVELQARLRPLDVAPQIDLGFYARAQAEAADPDDVVETNPAWRPVPSMPVHAGWLHAILRGHGSVADGLSIASPVCVLLSARSAIPSRWSEELTSADTVLVVDDIARRALKLGSSVTIERIDGALHDVFLSRRVARDDAYARLERWVTGWARASGN
ncbi:alpha/beta hydrolase [Microbacterium sp. AK031]|uniref:alpha/beta hydrolase n=1 Tax=Microbacterium sp. AK031 TaxID=2723076 RepID=UPI002168F5FF|nr:alpha/beta hydrolase [Microbacterium sp. AK031]MCS3842869.1 alpha-beta hydrolase superfamily lysophospholipase [Microbacterium sp. AK031]